MNSKVLDLSNLATKDDLKLLQNATKSDIKELEDQLGSKLDRAINQLDSLHKRMQDYTDEQNVNRGRIEELENIHPGGKHQTISPS